MNELDINQFRARNRINKVYAGKKKTVVSDGQVPKLFDLCIRTLKNNIDCKFFNIKL